MYDWGQHNFIVHSFWRFNYFCCYFLFSVIEIIILISSITKVLEIKNTDFLKTKIPNMNFVDSDIFIASLDIAKVVACFCWEHTLTGSLEKRPSSGISTSSQTRKFNTLVHLNYFEKLYKVSDKKHTIPISIDIPQDLICYFHPVVKLWWLEKSNHFRSDCKYFLPINLATVNKPQIWPGLKLFSYLGRCNNNYIRTAQSSAVLFVW